MNLKIHSVENKGDLAGEAVWLDVTDVGNYALCDGTYLDEGKVSNRLRHFFWFPDRKVKKGDWIKVYTKAGTLGTGSNKRGTTTHSFYWGLNESVWNKDGDCAILFQIAEWRPYRARGSGAKLRAARPRPSRRHNA